MYNLSMDLHALTLGYLNIFKGPCYVPSFTLVIEKQQKCYYEKYSIKYVDGYRLKNVKSSSSDIFTVVN